MMGFFFILAVVIGSIILVNRPVEEVIVPGIEQPAVVEPEPEPYQPETHTIEIGADFAKPDYLSIRQEDIVVWKNVGYNRRRFWINEEIYSDLLEPNQTYSYTFDELGDYTFRDVFNGKVVGAIVVKQQPMIQITGSFLEGFSQTQKTIIGVQFAIFMLAIMILGYTFIKK